MIPVSAIPEFQNITLASKDMADNADIRRQIIQAVPEANRQCRELAKYFGRNSQRETCKAIFDFLKKELTYRADGEVQVIKLPAALLRTRIGDCKSYSILTSGVLTNLGIPHHFVMTSYNADPTPSHIYVVCDDGTIIDAVWGTFDSEKTPTYKYEVKPNGTMKVKTMTGVGGCGCGCNSCGGMGKTKDERKAAKAQREINKDIRKAVREAEREAKKGMTDAQKDQYRETQKDGRKGRNMWLAVQPVFITGRSVVLIWLRWNVDGFATQFQKMNREKLNDLWHKVGGNTADLAEALRIGSQKPPHKWGILKYIWNRVDKKVRKKLKEKGKITGIAGEYTSEIVLPDQYKNMTSVVALGDSVVSAPEINLPDDVKNIIAGAVAGASGYICSLIIPATTSAAAAIGGGTGAAAGSVVPGAGTAAGAAAGTATGATAGASAGTVLTAMCVPVTTMVLNYGMQELYKEILSLSAGAALPDVKGKDYDPTTPNIPPVEEETESSNLLLYGGAALAAFLLLKK